MECDVDNEMTEIESWFFLSRVVLKVKIKFKLHFTKHVARFSKQ